MHVKNNRLSRIKSFIVYYGEGQISTLSSFDAAIIEPNHHKKNSIQKLKSTHTLTFAYLSIFELNPSNPEFSYYEKFALKDPSNPDKILINQDFLNPYMDLRNKEWTNYLYRKIHLLGNDYSFDGIFLDTLGNIEDTQIPDNIMYAQILALCDFLKRIRKDFPDLLLIQNNGHAVLLNYTIQFIQGICWENPLASTRGEKKLTKAIAKRLESMREKHQICVLLLTEKTSRKPFFSRLSKKHNFLYYDAQKDYLEETLNIP